MRNVQIDERIRLRHDIPQQNLHRGEIGTVRSMWCAPQIVYEVEFDQVGLDDHTRALLLEDQVEELVAPCGESEIAGNVDSSVYSA